MIKYLSNAMAIDQIIPLDYNLKIFIQKSIFIEKKNNIKFYDLIITINYIIF